LAKRRELNLGMKHLLLTLFLILNIKFIFFAQLKSNYWYSIYNKNNLKVEVSFDNLKGNCINNYPVTYKYRFNGYLGGYNEYLNWKIDYESCNSDNYTHGNGVLIGGIKIINELGSGKLEDQIKEEYDDKILINTFNNSLYDISVSKAKEYINKKKSNSVFYSTYSDDDYYFDKEKRKFFFNKNKSPFTGKLIKNSEEIYFLNGNLVESKKFHPNGQIKIKTEFFNNDFEDRMVYYWFDNGQLGSKLSYVDGNVSDIRCWDENANEFSEKQCLDAYGLNDDNGVLINMNESGKATIENGKKLTVLETCKDNYNFEHKSEKKYKCFNKESGVFESVGGCEIGFYLCGPYKVFSGNKLIVNQNYLNGRQEGLQIFKDENGNLQSKTIYKDDKIVYMKYLMESGDVYKEFDGPFFKMGSFIREYDTTDFNYFEQEFLGDGKTICKFYFKDGSLKREYESKWMIDFKTGYYKEYHENGNLRVAGNFSEKHFNHKKGDWKYYNSDGTIDAVEKFKIEEEIWPNGKSKILKMFFYDNQKEIWVKHGKWRYNDENGKTSYKTFKHGSIEVEENIKITSSINTSIITGSFGNISNAEKQKQNLISKGFQNININKVGNVHRVSILVSNNENAKKVLEEVKKHHKSAWISKD